MEIDTLCISSGGVNGFSYLGALSHLISVKYIDLDKIKTYVGSSIGALFSALIVLGYSIDELIEFTLNFNFTVLESDINYDNIFINHGICNNDKIKLMIEHFIKKKNYDINITFIELYNQTNKKLIITGTNITDAKIEYFDYINTPTMSILDAVQISSCLPIIFSPIYYNNKYYVDGGVASNMPINICNRFTTLGITAKYNLNIESIVSVLFVCINIALESQINISNYNLIIIETVSSSLNLQLDKEGKTKLIENGINAAKQYIINDSPLCINHKYTQTDNTQTENTQTENIVNENILL
jgi:predicted acylesterase/phospholipase RssA